MKSNYLQCRLSEAIHQMEDLFILAKRTDFHISLPISEDVYLHFDNEWSSYNDDEWNFSLKTDKNIILLGTLEQLQRCGNYNCLHEINLGVFDNLTVNLEHCVQRLLLTLPHRLYCHIVNWEEKKIYSSKNCVVEVDSNHRISLYDATQILKRAYQFMVASIAAAHKISRIEKIGRLTLVYFSKENLCGRMFFNQERNSIAIEINGNCVEEVEVPLLPVILELVEKQNYITKGQLEMIKFIYLQNFCT